MDSKEFIKALRTLIREEVRAAVREEIKVLTENKQQSKPKLKVDDIWESMGSTAGKSTRSTGAHTTTPKKSFSKDPLLNDLLNDTASRPIQINEGYDTIGTYSAEMAQGFGMMRSVEMSSTPVVAPARDLDGRPVNMDNEAVATVVNAMTKDYSALMKAIDKKKGK